MGFWKGVDWVTSNWKTITLSPGYYACIAFVISAIATYFIVTWRFQGIIENKDSTIQSKDATIQSKDGSIQELEKRLIGKDELINVYRLKLNEVTATGTAYTLLTNADLKRQTLALVNQMREFNSKMDSETHLTSDTEFVSIGNAKTEEERKAIWSSYGSKISQQYLQFTHDYDKQFQSKSILLRDELLSRLPKQERKGMLDSLYEHPTNPIGMGRLCNDLEQLALKLPKPSQYKQQDD